MESVIYIMGMLLSQKESLRLGEKISLSAFLHAFYEHSFEDGVYFVD